MTLDELRADRPNLGFAVYAYEPGKPVTLEIHDADGQTYSVTTPTLEAAIGVAFPSVVSRVPSGDESHSSSLRPRRYSPSVAEEADGPVETTGDVFS
jgi:hypothetical protein